MKKVILVILICLGFFAASRLFWFFHDSHLELRARASLVFLERQIKHLEENYSGLDEGEMGTARSHCCWGWTSSIDRCHSGIVLDRVNRGLAAIDRAAENAQPKRRW